MISVTSKNDVRNLISNFDSIATWDSEGNKAYFVFDDRKKNGKITLMQYPDGHWTSHSMGEGYCDGNEMPLSIEETVNLVWNHRSSVNTAMKTLVAH
jgi:hypothetical protein